MAWDYFHGFNFEECGIETTLTINYLTATGKGRFECHLDSILPCSKSRFKVILDMIRMQCDCTSQDAAAETLYKYIEFCYRELAKRREEYPNCAKESAKYTAEIKKYIALSETLAEYFDTPVLSDGEKIRFKSEFFYILESNEAGHTRAACIENGSTFVYAGRKFGIACRNKIWTITATDSGLSAIRYCTSKASAIEEFRKMYSHIEAAMNKDSYAEHVAAFTAKLIEAGYIEKPEEVETVSAPISEGATSGEEIPETPEKPVEESPVVNCSINPAEREIETENVPERSNGLRAERIHYAQLARRERPARQPAPPSTASCITSPYTGRKGILSGYFSPAPPGDTLRQVRGSPTLIGIGRKRDVYHISTVCNGCIERVPVRATSQVFCSIV